MCKKAVDSYPHGLEFIVECFMTQKMCDKAVDTYPSTIKFVPECFMIQEMSDKLVNIYLLYLILLMTGIKLIKCLFLNIFF